MKQGIRDAAWVGWSLVLSFFTGWVIGIICAVWVQGMKDGGGDG